MEKKLKIILVCMLLITTAIPIAGSINMKNSSKAIIIDQSQTIEHDCPWLDLLAWQQFVPDYEKHVKIEVYIKQGYEDSPPLKLSIEQPLGTKLSELDKPANEIPGTCDWVTFDIPDVDLIPGNIYYLVLSYAPGGEYAWCGATGDPYSAGESNVGSQWDWCFKTWVDDETGSPPAAPSIDGPESGTAGEEYEYKFSSEDPESEDVYFWIDWGDDHIDEWVGPYGSGEEAILLHTWENQNTYTISAKAKDVNDLESDWSYLEVTMPVNKYFYGYGLTLIKKIFEYFPMAFPIIWHFFNF